MVTKLSKVSEVAGVFSNRYPTDPRSWAARILQIQVDGYLSRMSGNSGDVAEKNQFQALIDDPSCPNSIRGQAQYGLLTLAMFDYQRGDPSVTSAAIIGQFNQLITTYPGFFNTDMLKVRVAQALEQSDPADAGSLLREVAASPQTATANSASAELAKLAKMQEPFALHFTAADGRPVDLASMTGRVVLIDFWATWCGPCRREIPNVIAAYKKYHDQGFEVIGISLDQDETKLLNFTAQNGMPWPQYFDGKGWQNDIAVANGIRSIPSMWLVNKKGVVVNRNARGILDTEIPTLLAEGSN
jgi:thiol-disulfide isomerase/thioredoxin